MATYKIDSSLLTAQADEIRTLNGTTATMNPSQMTTALQSANAEVATQEQKIIEITEMLQGKAMGGSGEDVTDEVTAQTELIADLESAVNALPEAGSGGSGGASVETCEVEFVVSNSGAKGTRYVLCQQVSEDGTTETTNVALSYGRWQGTTTTFTAKKGGLVLYHNNGSALDSNNASSVKNCEQVFGSLYFIAFEIGQKETAKIVVFT